MANCRLCNVRKSLYFYNFRHYMALYSRAFSHQYQVEVACHCCPNFARFSFSGFYFRNTGLGSCSLVARIGGVAATTVGNLAEININIPTILFGSTALISAALSFLLPETAGKPLPNTVAECVAFDSKSRGINVSPLPQTDKEDNES